MTEEPKSVQLTGGAGFGYEDEVSALFLAAIVSGTYPFGSDLGRITRLDWQIREDGWLLDDLAVSFQTEGSGILALSIKSDRQVTQGGFPASFVKAARTQWDAREQAAPFKEGRDLFGLVVGQLAQGVERAWNDLLNQSLVGASKRVACRYAVDGRAGSIGKALFKSLHAEDGEDTSGTIRFIRHIRLFHLDFKHVASRSEGFGIEMCQLALAESTPEEAVRLWDRLVAIAAIRRVQGGSLDLKGLVAILGDDFALAQHPDYRACWQALDRRSVETTSSIEETIGGKLSLFRPKIIDEARDRLQRGRCVLLTGDGGSGKSAIAKRLAVHSHSFSRCLWRDGSAFDHGSVAEMERSVGIKTPLQELLAACTSAPACLVVDGLETFTLHAKS